eukprot:scaffold30498_cov124-Isochrysis_galbana.AAC.1
MRGWVAFGGGAPASPVESSVPSPPPPPSACPPPPTRPVGVGRPTHHHLSLRPPSPPHARSPQPPAGQPQPPALPPQPPPRTSALRGEAQPWPLRR